MNDRRLGMRLPSRWTDRDHRRARFLNPSALPLIPPAFDWSTALPAPEIDDNDRLGNCTCASIAHYLEIVSALNGDRVIPTTAQVDELYGKVNGGRDEGANMGDVLNALETDGLAGVKVIGRALLDAKNDSQFAAACYVFAGVYQGGTVYNYCLQSKTWDASTPPVAGGHATLAAAWDGMTLAAKTATWNEYVTVTRRFRQANIDEAYAVFTTAHVNPKTGRTWHGFTWSQVQSFLVDGFGGSLAPGVVPPAPVAYEPNFDDLI